MPLVTLSYLLKKAQKGKYAVPAFNINNMEILQGVARAAEKENAPVIVGVSEGAIKYAGLDYIKAMVDVASTSKVKIALHLDHGKDMEVIKDCIKAGFTSIMIDASYHEFNENVKITKKVVKMCHKKGISVEAELGKLRGVEDNVNVEKGIFTEPDEAVEFVKKTNVDALAVAIGTSHGAYKFKGKSNLRFDILKEIKEKVKIPLVLHGSSEIPIELIRQANTCGAKIKGAKGVPNKDVKKAIKLGICKINIDSDLRLAFTVGMRQALCDNPENIDPRKVLGSGRDQIEKVATEKIRLFGCKNKN
jgi:fructose-bisphosphate aldolase, class II